MIQKFKEGKIKDFDSGYYYVIYIFQAKRYDFIVN